jgi:hypothetical protein
MTAHATISSWTASTLIIREDDLQRYRGLAKVGSAARGRSTPLTTLPALSNTGVCNRAV